MTDQKTQGHPRNGAENAVFGVSLVLVLALLATLGLSAWRGPAGPADIRATASEARASEARASGARGSGGRGALATLTVRNAGGVAAEDVRVEACGRGGPTAPDVCAEAQIPYIPAGAERSAVVGFAKAPAGALSARVVSYLEP